MNSQISTGNTGQQGNLGIGFAIPSNTVRNVVAQIIQNGHVEHAYLGIRVQELSPSIAQLFRLPVKRGLLVAQVEPGSGAAKAGLQGPTNQAMVAGVSWPLGGDIIVAGRRDSDAERQQARATCSQTTSPETRSSSSSTAAARRRRSR